MINSLDEAIKHCEEVAEENEKLANTYESFKDYGNPKSSITSGHEKCLRCAKEQRQLAEWLKDYKRLLEQQPCEDCISRQAVLDQTYNWSKDEFLRVTNPFDYLRKKINDLPSATPKTGHWILYRDHKNMVDYPQCDNCSVIIKLPLPMDNLNYCPNCGAKMVEPQESEDKK